MDRPASHERLVGVTAGILRQGVKTAADAGINENNIDAAMLTLPGPTAPADLPLLPTCRDPDDQKFLELAQASGAQWLISKDRDLLKLARRTRKAGLFLILKPEQWSPVLIGRSFAPHIA